MEKSRLINAASAAGSAALTAKKFLAPPPVIAATAVVAGAYDLYKSGKDQPNENDVSRVKEALLFKKTESQMPRERS